MLRTILQDHRTELLEQRDIYRFDLHLLDTEPL